MAEMKSISGLLKRWIDTETVQEQVDGDVQVLFNRAADWLFVNGRKVMDRVQFVRFLEAEGLVVYDTVAPIRMGFEYKGHFLIYRGYGKTFCRGLSLRADLRKIA